MRVHQTSDLHRQIEKLPRVETYYLEFHNPGFLAGERTTQVDFYVQYD